LFFKKNKEIWLKIVKIQISERTDQNVHIMTVATASLEKNEEINTIMELVKRTARKGNLKLSVHFLRRVSAPFCMILKL
jgi:hypothetical protein